MVPEESRSLQDVIVVLHRQQVNAKMESHSGNQIFIDLIQVRKITLKHK